MRMGEYAIIYPVIAEGVWWWAGLFGDKMDYLDSSTVIHKRKGCGMVVSPGGKMATV